MLRFSKSDSGFVYLCNVFHHCFHSLWDLQVLQLLLLQFYGLFLSGLLLQYIISVDGK